MNDKQKQILFDLYYSDHAITTHPSYDQGTLQALAELNYAYEFSGVWNITHTGTDKVWELEA